MKLRLLSIVLVIWTSQVFAEMDPPAPPKCRSTMYIVDSNVAMHSEPSISATVVAVLKFNLPVCVYKYVSGWNQISLDPLLTKGWVKEDQVSFQPRTYDQDVSEIYDAQARKDFKRAIAVAERALGAENFPKGEYRRALLLKLEELYGKIGNSIKSNEFRKKRESLIVSPDTEKSSMRGEPAPFADWFFSQFSNSSGYLYRFSDSSERDGATHLVLDELTRELASPNSPELIQRFAKEAGHFFSDLYSTYGESIGNSSELGEEEKLRRMQFRRKLAHINIIKLAIRSSEAGMNVDVIETLSAETINSPEIAKEVLEACRDAEHPSVWRRFSAQTVERSPTRVFECVSAEKLNELLEEFPFLLGRNFAVQIVNGKQSPEKIGYYFSRLPVDIRSDFEFVRKVMKHEADIYLSVSDKIRSRQDFRTYAAKTSDCQNLIRLGSKDKELVSMAIDRMDRKCVKLLDPVLRNDLVLAKLIAKERPEAFDALPASIWANTDLIILALNSHAQSICPFQSIPEPVPLSIRRLIIKKNSTCLEALKGGDFLDRDIYMALVGNRLSMNVLKKLPERFQSDPKIPLLLPEKIETTSDRDIVERFIESKVLLDVARLNGVESLSRVVAVDAIKSADQVALEAAGADVYFEERRWSPARSLTWEAEFWTGLISIGRQRNTTCENWKSLIESWELSSKDHSKSPVENFIKDINNQFSCAINLSEGSE